MEDLRLHMATKQPIPHLSVMGDMALRLGRVHEFCGPARRTLALRVAARLDGPVIWIRPGWQVERLNPEGVVGLGVEPGRLILVDPRKGEDILWAAEEALRSGAVALVVCEVHTLPGLTPVRRLHLAAEAGAAASGAAPPLGLLLAQARGGVPGVESRWYMTCTHGAAGDAWRLERRRARAEPPMAWLVGCDGKTRPVTARRPAP